MCIETPSSSTFLFFASINQLKREIRFPILSSHQIRSGPVSSDPIPFHSIPFDSTETSRVASSDRLKTVGRRSAFVDIHGIGRRNLAVTISLALADLPTGRQVRRPEKHISCFNRPRKPCQPAHSVKEPSSQQTDPRTNPPSRLSSPTSLHTIRLSFHLSIYPSTRLSIHPSIHPLIWLYH